MLDWDTLGKLWVMLLGATVFVWLFAYMKRKWYGDE